MVFLIDGTAAVRSEFPAIREMIRRVVEKLDVGLDRIRISVVQYSDDAKVEFLLNEFSTKDEVRQAVIRLKNRGGNRLNTGHALEWVTKNIYQRSAGSRIEEGVPQFLILVTGGKSADDVSGPAEQLKRNLVAPLAIGSRNADLNELRQISLTPELVYTVDRFQNLPEVELQLIASVNKMTADDIATSYVPTTVHISKKHYIIYPRFKVFLRLTGYYTEMPICMLLSTIFHRITVNQIEFHISSENDKVNTTLPPIFKNNFWFLFCA